MKNLTKKQFDAIDWAGLESEISNRLGMSITLSKELDSKDYVRVETQDLSNYAGVMSSVYRQLVVDNFGGYLCDDDENALWLSIHFSWQYKGMGTNGTEFFHAYYNLKSKKWTFKETWKGD